MGLIDKEFPVSNEIIYLNHAAVAPWPMRTREAVRLFAEENVKIGARYYSQWLKKETELRGQIKRLINATSINDIALLKNTSEALSVVAAGLDWHEGDNVVTSNEEFPSNRIPWQALAGKGVELKEVNIGLDGPEQALINACDENTRLLTISSVQYGSGIRPDLERLGRFCKERGILFCVDAIQSIGAVNMDVQAIRADYVMADGHKWMLGPEGIALFYSTQESRDRLELHQFGWHMVENTDFNVREWQVAGSARRFECGSPNMLGIHALSASLSLFEEIGMQEIENMVLANTAYLIEQLKTIDGVKVRTPEQQERHAGIVSFTIDGIDLAQLQADLLENNVLCVYRGGGIRLSPHFYITREILDRFIEILRRLTG